MEMIPAGAVQPGAAFILPVWLLPLSVATGTRPLISLIILCNNSMTA